MTQIDVEGAKRACYATDNYCWLAAGEEREVAVEILWREPAKAAKPTLAVWAWNASKEIMQISPGRKTGKKETAMR